MIRKGLISLLLIPTLLQASECSSHHHFFIKNEIIQDVFAFNMCLQSLDKNGDREYFCEECLESSQIQNSLYQSGKKNQDHQEIAAQYQQNIYQAMIDEFKKSFHQNMRASLLLSQDVDWLASSQDFARNQCAAKEISQITKKCSNRTSKFLQQALESASKDLQESYRQKIQGKDQSCLNGLQINKIIHQKSKLIMNDLLKIFRDPTIQSLLTMKGAHKLSIIAHIEEEDILRIFPNLTKDEREPLLENLRENTQYLLTANPLLAYIMEPGNEDFFKDFLHHIEQSPNVDSVYQHFDRLKDSYALNLTNQCGQILDGLEELVCHATTNDKLNDWTFFTEQFFDSSRDPVQSKLQSQNDQAYLTYHALHDICEQQQNSTNRDLDKVLQKIQTPLPQQHRNIAYPQFQKKFASEFEEVENTLCDQNDPSKVGNLEKIAKDCKEDHNFLGQSPACQIFTAYNTLPKESFNAPLLASAMTEAFYNGKNDNKNSLKSVIEKQSKSRQLTPIAQHKSAQAEAINPTNSNHSTNSVAQPNNSQPIQAPLNNFNQQSMTTAPYEAHHITPQQLTQLANKFQHKLKNNNPLPFSDYSDMFDKLDKQERENREVKQRLNRLNQQVHNNKNKNVQNSQASNINNRSPASFRTHQTPNTMPSNFAGMNIPNSSAYRSAKRTETISQVSKIPGSDLKKSKKILTPKDSSPAIVVDELYLNLSKNEIATQKFTANEILEIQKLIAQGRDFVITLSEQDQPMEAQIFLKYVGGNKSASEISFTDYQLEPLPGKKFSAQDIEKAQKLYQKLGVMTFSIAMASGEVVDENNIARYEQFYEQIQNVIDESI